MAIIKFTWLETGCTCKMKQWWASCHWILLHVHFISLHFEPICDKDHSKVDQSCFRVVTDRNVVLCWFKRRPVYLFAWSYLSLPIFDKVRASNRSTGQHCTMHLETFSRCTVLVLTSILCCPVASQFCDWMLQMTKAWDEKGVISAFLRL